ncbi:uncharacterized protein [Drosophila tropicalis]|uniref:uncharacterized protein n=1 Tax=Drosophila tropicalis TaxID=46794 RepID=UPI0035ABB7AD
MLKELAIYICILVVICQGRTLPTEITTTATIAEEVETTEASTEESSTLASLAVSRDEEASILIDPAQGSTALQHLDDKSQQKSAKLLLLSAPPKRHTVEMEQQFEEQDETQDNPTAAASATNDEAATTTTTQASLEVEVDTTTNATHEDNMDATTTAATTTTEAITKLFAINATVASMDAPPPTVAVALAMDNSTVSIAEQPQEAGNNNAAIELALVEPEAEYVLVSDDDDNDEHHHELGEFGELQLGSFTHIDSDVHLQPVVHSVEIVPTSFDDPLIVNYVHNLR